MRAVSEDALVSVIIPHYQDVDRLDICLSALERQSLPRERFEIIVADNASPIGLAEIERVVAGRAHVVEVPEKGAGPARNGGAAVAQGEVLAFTDCDCVPDAHWLAAGLKALDNADVVGGRMDVLIQRPGHPTPVEAFEQVFGFDNESYVKRKGFTVTANLFVRRSDFERIGPYRTAVSEDVEWCQRAGAMGLKLVYDDATAVGHPARRDWAELKRKWERIVEELYRLACTRSFGRTGWLARTWALPISAFAHVPKVLRSPQLKSTQARLGAIAILFRSRFWRFWAQQRVMLVGR